jgi:hypothetical protein
LTYDSLLETKIFPNKITNGFNGAKFNPITVCKETGNRIIRLHGCTNFSINLDLPVNQINGQHSTNYFNERNLYWTDNPSTNTSIGTFQLGKKDFIYYIDGNPISSLVTGKDKYSFFNIEPYRTYYNISKDILRNKRLLVIGYNKNKNDDHINRFITQNNYSINFSPEKRNTKNSSFLGFKESTNKFELIIDYLKK